MDQGTRIQAPAVRKEPDIPDWGIYAGNNKIFICSIYTAVCNESGYPHDSGAGKQLWRCVMAAFTAAVKIDSFAYMPAQEFGNAFSLFISQNHGAGKENRIQKGTRQAFVVSALFCGVISVLVFLLAKNLMLFFVSSSDTEIIQIGAGYLRIEGAFYIGIGILFLLYGYYRGINIPEMSLV